MGMGGRPTLGAERVVNGRAPEGKVLLGGREASDPKWTAERLASLRAVIEAARAFVRSADEFVPADGSRFYPGALEEHSAALDDAILADGRAWDG